MDNFILYDEIAKNDSSIIYKGRRKGSINFVAIHCIEKHLRPEITNLVRLTFEMSHKNVVKFHEWYETSNHLWLVVELCTAGSLDSIMEQDGCFPENSIKKFGQDLCEGLFYIHSIGVLFCDLMPRKIMVDGSGHLKLSDFGFAKLEGEDLETIFRETFESTSSQWSQSMPSNAKEAKLYKKPFGDLKYIAPEVLSGEENTQASDLWSLGCMLYQMYTASCPFVSDDPEHLKNMILTKELPNPKGNKLSTKPSPEFLSLIRGLLEKNPNKRLNWKQVLHHPFWENKLKHLINMKSIFVDGKEQSIENEAEKIDDANAALLTDRPRTATLGASIILDQKPEINASFSISSRQQQQQQVKQLSLQTTSNLNTRNGLQCKESNLNSSNASTLIGSQNFENIKNDAIQIRANESKKYFFMPSELNASQIIDNPKIQKTAAPKFDPKTLPFSSNSKLFKAETFLKLSREEYEKSIELIKMHTNVPSDKSAGAMKLKMNLMNFVSALCYESSKLADSFVQVELFKDLLSIIKNGYHIEMKTKAARVFGILFRRATKIDESKEMVETMQSLLDVISANRKDLKFKQSLLPALGELIYFLCSQEEKIGKCIEHWSIPSLAYVIFIRSIGDDVTSNHIICKIIENVASTSSQNVHKFLQNQSEVVNALWSCYTCSTNTDNLRIAALNALAKLTSHSISIFNTLLDKIGPDSIIDGLAMINSNVQQALLTIISMYFNEANSKNFPEKVAHLFFKLISKLAPIYESTNVACRAKAYLLTYFLIKNQNELLLLLVQSKLINSIDRDNRKSFPNKEEDDYIHNILNMLISQVSSFGSNILDECISALEAVYGRKNPSSAQSKQLKRAMPNMHILKILLSSQSFRSKLLDEKFVEKLGRLIKLSKPINNGELNLEAICEIFTFKGAGTMSDYMDSLTSVLEAVIRHKETLKAFSDKIMKFVAPSLMENIDIANSEFRLESIKLISDLSILIFNKQEQICSDSLRDDLKFLLESHFFDLFEKILGQSEPLPYFALSICQSALNYDVTLINCLKVKNVLPSLFRLLQNNKPKIGSNLVIKLLNIVNVWSSTIDPSDLYEEGVIDCLKSMLLEISRIRKLDDKNIIETLIELLKIADNLLKFVSEFVKKALQAKKTAGPGDTLAQQAEKLLHANKRLVVFAPYLITLVFYFSKSLTNEDSDLNELSSKILWVLMQLFGGECKDLFNQENLRIFSNAIMTSSLKRQKILLRILKRIITADKQNVEQLKTVGQNLMEILKNLKSQADTEANVALSSAIDEILKVSSN